MKTLEQLKGMDEARFFDIYRSLENKGFGPLDAEVARALKFRPHAIKKLPMEQRARRARALLERTSNADLAYELFGSYLVHTRKDLVTEFLDATGVPHEDGILASDQARPDPTKLEEAISALDGKHAPEDVTLYLAICAQQWPDAPELESLLRARSSAPGP